MTAPRRILGPILLTIAAAAPGCGRVRPPALGTVEGKIRFDEKPLADATVVFQPLPEGRASRGVTDSTGRFRLTYLRDLHGAVVGMHEVRITTADEMTPAERLPGRYHGATELRATVARGSNRIDFDLQSAEGSP